MAEPAEPGPEMSEARASARGCPTRTVTFQEDVEASEATDADAHRARYIFSLRSLSHRMTTLSGRSMWRYPTTVGQLPRYMRRAFRMKTFGLMSFQLLLVLGIMVLVDCVVLRAMVPPDGMDDIVYKVVFYCLGLLNLGCVVALQCLKDRFPLNYALLGLTTLMSGLFWGMTRVLHAGVSLHFQIMGILAFTMCFSTVVSAILVNTEEKMKGTHLISGLLGLGWFIGSSLDVVIAAMLLQSEQMEILGALGFSFLLLCLLLIDAGSLLVKSSPDDFMTVVVAMDSTLLVVVSIPFFVLSFCFLHTGEAIMQHQDSEQPPVAMTAIPEATTSESSRNS
ncbi:unnamed protein product [Effrenium voratum]|nr:unnamed protein product [Effrenium voratum]